ncbi:hypothetical protein FF011L_47430 [Roseimaritima multifibrata]|uniref:Uncharacterized protein n=1 Tax=Roseimaritima multifibrata TaxID=1930274 RepID=A0A517MM28_9BACT|nr:hypothetical protein [Roseimaritima multifibrata]QDS95941.1 hypothetical protein FF011L_47430 [Roseimaritima multifibrata]
MARRVVSRKDKIAEAEATEAEKSAKKAKKAKTSKRKTKAKPATEVRMKMYWGVFSQSLKRIAVFEYDQKTEAEKRAEELSKGGKSPHFVQKVKEEIGLD